MATVDDSLPFIANILLANVVSLLGIVVILAYSQPMLLPIFIPLHLGYTLMQASQVCSFWSCSVELLTLL